MSTEEVSRRAPPRFVRFFLWGALLATIENAYRRGDHEQPLLGEHAKEWTVRLRLSDLPDMHPCLLWDDILAAAAAVMTRRESEDAYRLSLQMEDVPGWGSSAIDLEILLTGVEQANVAKVQRTYEANRLVELAAIAMAGLALFHAGGHQIRDVSLRGSAADYLVDLDGHVLEVAGRSRRRDFDAAWTERWQRLSGREGVGFYVFVTEFETPSARLGFGSQEGDRA